QRRSAGHRRRPPAGQGGAGDQPGQPDLGPRLQRHGHPAGSAWLYQPAVRRDRHGGQFAPGRGQQPAAAALLPSRPPASRPPASRPPASHPPARPPVSQWVTSLGKAAAAPVLCAAALIGLLSAFVSGGGAGTVSRARIRIEVTLADIPMPAASAARPAASAARPAATRAYLTIRNVSGTPDELTGARTPAARRVALARPVTIPAHGTVTLTPFG